MSKDFLTFLRAFVGTAASIALAFLLVMGVFGMIDLWDSVRPAHLVCVKAHDEFHQTDNGTLIQVCDLYLSK